MGTGCELTKVSDDERQLVGDDVLFGQGFNLLDGCVGERNFMNGGTCNDAVGWKMEKLMPACRAASGIQTDAVKGASRWSVGGIGFVVCLNKAAKRMLTVNVVV